MITAGIDVGTKNIKIVILDSGKIVAKGCGLSGGVNRSDASDIVWDNTLNSAGLVPADVEKVVATGAGKFDVVFADENVAETTADARCGRYINPAATSVIDVGAVQTRVITLGQVENKIHEVALNQKCGACLGVLLEVMADRLEIPLETFGGGDTAEAKAIVSDGCPVFAELDALELLNQGISVGEVANAVAESIAVRINTVLNEKIIPEKNSTVLIGGVAKNTAVVNFLKARSEINFIIPENSEYGGAIGAALIAVD
jgi:benzoyl-CoA reductase subunit D